MTSEDRHEARYQRRCIRREERRRERYTSFEESYTFENLWKANKKCRKGKRYRGSVQRYDFAAPIRTVRILNKLYSGKYRPLPPHEWDTWERGKKRHIKSTTFTERVVHSVFADKVLFPVIQPILIYDNGACMVDKGYTHCVKRVNVHLHNFYRRCGTEGYIAIGDFKGYYDSIDQHGIDARNAKRIPDSRLNRLGSDILHSTGERGISLGNQTSPLYALDAANALDHYIKEVLQIEEYVRYNDDFFLLSDSKSHLQYCMERIKEKCDDLHLTLSPKKTQIIKLSHGFKFLKARIFPLDGGKVLRKIPKERITVERRKLKKLRKKLDQGCIDLPHIEMQYQSWRAFACQYFSAKHTVADMDALFKELFPNGKIHKKRRKRATQVASQKKLTKGQIHRRMYKKNRRARRKAKRSPM